MIGAAAEVGVGVKDVALGALVGADTVACCLAPWREQSSPPGAPAVPPNKQRL